jgi:Domain of unknown function (DUF4783)
MKKIVLVVFNVLLISHLLQAQDDVLVNVKAQFKQGNAHEVARYFNDFVEISIDGEKGNYSKTQAEFVLRDFFKKNNPLDFQKIHQGSSKEGLTFMIGKYTSTGSTGSSYRVYIVVKQFKGAYLVDTIDFSKE